MSRIRMAHFHALPGGLSDDGYRQALRMLETGVAFADADGAWLEFNPAFERLLDGNPALRPGGDAAACIAAAERERFARELSECARSGGHRDAVWCWLRGDGRALRARTRLAPLAGPRGTAQPVIVQIEPDVSAPADEAAAPSIEEQHSMQLFVDKVAHDLRAPLRSIGSFATLLARRAAPRFDDTDRDYLERIRAAAARMDSLLSALSDYSRAMRAELRPAPVDLSLLAEWVAIELREDDPGRPAEIRVQPGLHGWGDERLLRLMLAQLLGNAWKFSRDCERVLIDVDGEREGDRVQIRVRDRGCGFDMQYSSKLFEPFQRLHGAELGGGHGLGLATARCIARRHGGELRAESRPGAGSVFTVELPATGFGETGSSSDA